MYSLCRINICDIIVIDNPVRPLTLLDQLPNEGHVDGRPPDDWTDARV